MATAERSALSADARRALEAFADDPATPPRHVLRALIVLEAAAGGTNGEVAARLGTSAPTVALWRARYARHGLDGLRDRPRPGRPRARTAAEARRRPPTERTPRTTAPAVRYDGRSLADATLDRLLAAATRTIARRGFGATRVSDIAREADVSPASIHYHFRTKEEILVRALLWANARLVSQLEQATAEPEDVVTRLARFLERSIPYAGTQRDEYLLEIDLWSHVRMHPELLPAWERYEERWLTGVRELIEEGAATGAFAPVAPSDEVAERLVALTDGLGAQAAIEAARMPPDRVRRLVLRFTGEQLGVPYEVLDERARGAWPRRR